MNVVDDWAGGIDGSEAWRGGDECRAFCDRVGLTELRGGSGVLALMGSSTMYMGVSTSRNSARDQSYIVTCDRDRDLPSSLGTPAMMSS